MALTQEQLDALPKYKIPPKQLQARTLLFMLRRRLILMNGF